MGRLRDLEAENAELKTQVEFFKSWLEGEVSQPDTKELKRLRRELTAARGAASALEAELNGLRQRFESALDDLRRQSERADSSRAEADAEKQRADDLGRQLVDLTEDHARLARRADKGARRWHSAWAKNRRMPHPGEYVLVCTCFIADIMEQIADGSSRVTGAFMIRDAFSREDSRGGYEFDGVPDGHIVMAWQPLVEPDWNAVQTAAIAGLKYWSEDAEGRARELAIARKRGGSGAEARLRRLQDRVKSVLNKSTYRPVRDRQGKDLLFLKSRTHTEN